MSRESEQLSSSAPLTEDIGLLQQLREVRTLFGLVLVAELLSLVLVIARFGLAQFDMVYFGLVSFQILWIVLGAIAVMYCISGPLARYTMVTHLLVSYVVVLLLTLLTSLAGQVFIHTHALFDYFSVFNSMSIAAIFAGVFLRFIYLQAQLQQQRQSETTAKLSALQARIRPHFLFNSLNSIASLIPLDPVAAEKMVVDLAHLFRASIKHRGLVPLNDELTLCRRYVAIESLRFGNKLRVDWQIDINDQQAQAPAILLQPLVENAIVHGIQGLTEGGSICVKVTAEHGDVALSVSNPVPASGWQSPELQAQEEHNGMALENIKHRLSTYFGDSAEFTATLNTERQLFTVAVRYKSGEP